MADPVTIVLAGASILGGLLGGNKDEIGQLARQLGVQLSGRFPPTNEDIAKLKEAMQKQQQQGIDSQNALLDNYKQLTDPKSKFYTDIASKLLGAQDQKTASVGTLLGVGLASGIPYQVATKYADQQRKAIEAQNRESVNNIMGNLFLQGQAQGMNSLGQFNQLQENQANRMFQSSLYDKQSSQSMQNQWLSMGFGLLGSELGSNRPKTNYNTPDNPYFKPFWADTSEKVGNAVSGWR